MSISNKNLNNHEALIESLLRHLDFNYISTYVFYKKEHHHDKRFTVCTVHFKPGLFSKLSVIGDSHCSLTKVNISYLKIM